jgi:hypothetical protein
MVGILNRDFNIWRKGVGKHKLNKILLAQFRKETNSKFNSHKYQGSILEGIKSDKVKNIVKDKGKATTGEVWREFNIKYSPICMKTIKRELDNLVIDGFLTSEPTQMVRGRSTMYEVIKLR